MSDIHFDDPPIDDKGKELTPLDLFMAPYRGLKWIKNQFDPRYRRLSKRYEIKQDGDTVTLIPKSTPTPTPTITLVPTPTPTPTPKIKPRKPMGRDTLSKIKGSVLYTAHTSYNYLKDTASSIAANIPNVTRKIANKVINVDPNSIEKSSLLYGVIKGLTFPSGDKLTLIQKAGDLLVYSSYYGFIGKAIGVGIEAIQNLFASNPYVEEFTGPIQPKKLDTGVTEGVQNIGKILRTNKDFYTVSKLSTGSVGKSISRAARSFNPWHPSKKNNAYQYNRNAYNISPYRRSRYYRPYYKRRMRRRYYKRRKNYRYYY